MIMERNTAKAVLDIKGGMPYETLAMYVARFLKHEYGMYSDFEYCVDYCDFYTPDMLDDCDYSDELYKEVKQYFKRSTTK